MVHPRSQTQHGESVAKPRAFLLIIRSLVCKSDIKDIHGNLSNPFFEKNTGAQKIPIETDTCRNDIPYIIHFTLGNYCQHPVQDSRYPVS